jgi:hypothetical protein
MQQIQYPPMTDESRSLTDLLSIESRQDYDTIYLGSPADGKFLGYIEYQNEVFRFYPETQTNSPFPARTTYYSSLFDSIVFVINDLDLCVELCILTNRKVSKEGK